MTRLARSYGILVPEIMGYLSDCGACRVVKAKSLKQMSIVMELGDGSYVWYVVGGVAAAGDEDEDILLQKMPWRPVRMAHREWFLNHFL